MLKELYIKNLAVIHEERLLFSKGFQVLTGETGAGKSILVDAIGLVMGEKANSHIIRDDADMAVVEAVFNVSDNVVVKEILKEKILENIEDKGELIIKRVLSRNGKNQLLINHQRATLADLQNISSRLIDFTGQFEQITLLNSANDIVILDHFVENTNTLTEYKSVYLALKEINEKIERLNQQKLQKKDRLSWLKFQYKEFEQLKITSEDAEQEMMVLRQRRKNQAEIDGFHRQTLSKLQEGNHSVLSQLDSVLFNIQKSDVLKELFGGFVEKIEDVRLKAEDLSFELSQASHDSPQEENMSLDDIEEALYNLEQLKRKHGSSLTEVLNAKQAIENEIYTLENADHDTKKLIKQRDETFAKLIDLGKKLHSLRIQAKTKIEKAIKEELKTLHMPQVSFEVSVELLGSAKDMNLYHAKGLDKVCFLLSTNPGLKPRPLAKIASGGETSRIFLAIKKVMADFQEQDTYIFDEIDTGISGAASELVGQKLKALSEKCQVFCVTHSPQIAALAHDHYFVQKQIKDKTTLTRVTRLGDNDRVNEVARLMGGVKITQKNLAYAGELIKNTKH